MGDIGQDLGLGAPAQDPAAVPDAGDVLGTASEEDVSSSHISPPLLLFCQFQSHLDTYIRIRYTIISLILKQRHELLFQSFARSKKLMHDISLLSE